MYGNGKRLLSRFYEVMMGTADPDQLVAGLFQHLPDLGKPFFAGHIISIS
jgi:hypothetical protein